MGAVRRCRLIGLSRCQRSGAVAYHSWRIVTALAVGTGLVVDTDLVDGTGLVVGTGPAADTDLDVGTGGAVDTVAAAVNASPHLQHTCYPETFAHSTIHPRRLRGMVFHDCKGYRYRRSLDSCHHSRLRVATHQQRSVCLVISDRYCHDYHLLHGPDEPIGYGRKKKKTKIK